MAIARRVFPVARAAHRNNSGNCRIMTKSVTTLDDKYTETSGRVFLSANQALVRLPLDQARRDRAAGLKTTGFISGYRGSPLGVYDAALWGAQRFLDEYDIRFNPGLNEELAATSIRGTQGLAWYGKSEYEGVFGLWYGKGLGVDRACESLKLGNLEGAAEKGGFLVIAGDDHGGKSSASAHQSEHTLIAGFIPVLYPSTIAEIIEFGLYGWALSRYSGLYVGMKCITDTLDLTSSVELPDIHREFVLPDFPAPPGGRNISDSKLPLELEALVLDHRHPAAQAFVRANPIDKVIYRGERRELGLVAAGKAYLDLRQALEDLGLTEARCAELGIGLYKPGLIWPIEAQGATAFAQGYKALLIVEEKRPVMEDQFARVLYDQPADARPAITGKQSLKGKPLLPAIGELSAPLVRKAVYTLLTELGLADDAVSERYRWFHDLEGKAIVLGSGKARPAFYCSGCPHNTSTRVPDGSYAMAAVGCQGLAAYVMPERRTMLPMPMGGEGTPWISVGPLVEREHMFQNMGDGTYSHSGLLAIRASVAANSRITYKLLFNDAVAMTGGQPVEMHISPMDMVNQLVSEGVKPVVLMSDDIAQYAHITLPANTTVRHRDELDTVQRELRETLGVSAIVYEQTCATEKRRRRKRGTYPDPDKRVFINPEVCEGCGDCSVQSNCVSITPLETEFGRKRRIDQSTCNKDFSCLKGFCPSFVTVEGAKIATPAGADPVRLDGLLATLPDAPTRGLDTPYSILVGGIGGTGVLTIGALLGMAAHLEGKGCTVLDMTGMAQKGGAVTSHIRVAKTPDDLNATRLSFGYADLLMACDAIVGSGQDFLKTINPGKTVAIVNEDVTPTGEFQTNRNANLDDDGLVAAIRGALKDGPLHLIHGSALATALIGDSIGTNVFLLGFAAQLGALPVSVASLEEAIRLNGTFVKGNLRIFALGRLAAHAPDELARLIRPATPKLEDMSLDAILDSRTRRLTAYQNGDYAAQYTGFVREMEAALAAKGLDGSDILVRDIALTLAQLMAYKDEYEVARLHSDPAFWGRLKEQFDGDFKVSFHLAPPILPGRDASGRPRKRKFGAWMVPAFRLLARMKGVRGTALDVFGYTAERRMERQLIADYQAMMRDVVARVDAAKMPLAIELASAASDVRGYGPVKETAFAEYEARRAELLAAFESNQAAAAATQISAPMRA